MRYLFYTYFLLLPPLGLVLMKIGKPGLALLILGMVSIAMVLLHICLVRRQADHTFKTTTQAVKALLSQRSSKIDQR